MRGSFSTFVDLYRFRELVRNLVSRELKVRYKRSRLGIAWTMLNPLLQMTIYTVVFSHVMRANVQNYPVFVLAALVPWLFLHQSVSQSVPSLIVNAGLIRKIRLPKVVFPFSVVASNLVNLLFSLAPLTVILLATGAPLSPALFFLPVSILVLTLFAGGIALFMSSLVVFFRDVSHLVEVFFSVWFYLTPVIYEETMVPEKYRFLIQANPARFFVELFRAPIFEQRLPDGSSLATAAALALATFAIGWWVFHWNDRRYIHYL